MKSTLVKLILSSILILASCNIEEEIYDEVKPETLYDNENISINFAAPVYAWLHYLWGWGTIWMVNEATTDELIQPITWSWDQSGENQQLNSHTWESTNNSLFLRWVDLEDGIGRANSALNLLNNLDSDSQIEVLNAEVRFLRAFYRFWQLDYFRQITFRAEDDLNYQAPPPVLNAKESFEWLENELIEIIPLLKDRDQTAYGRVNKGAAQTLLAKLYLNAEVYIGDLRWEDCLGTCKNISESNQYGIDPDYFNIFGVYNENNIESIFVIRRARSNDLISFPPFSKVSRSGVQWGGYNQFCVRPDFIYSWDSDGEVANGINTDDDRFRDDRIMQTAGMTLGFLIGPQFNADGSPIPDYQLSTPGNVVQLDYTVDVGEYPNQHEGVRVAKYEPDLERWMEWGSENNDIIIFRYADVLLMAAETKFRLGKWQEALDDINDLRRIRNAPVLSSLSLLDILDERGFELYWEGWRRQDLIRFDRFTNAWTHKPESEKYREVFPIAPSALAINPNLVQNPGY